MFDGERFIEYIMEYYLSSYTESTCWCRELLENLVQWFTETYSGDPYEKGRVLAALTSIIPEIEEDEIDRFWKV